MKYFLLSQTNDDALDPTGYVVLEADVRLATAQFLPTSHLVRGGAWPTASFAIATRDGGGKAAAQQRLRPFSRFVSTSAAGIYTANVQLGNVGESLIVVVLPCVLAVGCHKANDVICRRLQVDPLW